MIIMTTTIITAHSVFLEAWNNAPKIEFNTEWKNKTGYLDFLTDEPDLNLNLNDFVATTDDLNRKVLIKCIGVGLQHVIFERHPIQRPGVLVCNTPHPKLLKGLNYNTKGFQSSLSLGSVQVFLGQKVPTALIKPDDIEELLSTVHEDTNVNTITKIVEDIESGEAIPLHLLSEIGIDVDSIDFSFMVKEWNK